MSLTHRDCTARRKGGCRRREGCHAVRGAALRNEQIGRASTRDGKVRAVERVRMRAGKERRACRRIGTKYGINLESLSVFKILVQAVPSTLNRESHRPSSARALL